MKLLLDTHILLWALTDDARLPVKARKLIEDAGNDICYSVVSPWEAQIKHDLHPDKLDVTAQELAGYCEQAGFRPLPIRLQHVFGLDSLQREEGARVHKDPFDRILVCQASAEKMLLVTHDARIGEYTEPCVFVV